MGAAGIVLTPERSSCREILAVFVGAITKLECFMVLMVVEKIR